MFSLWAKKTVVLVVENEAIVRMCAVEFIEDPGFEVLQASTAAEAIELLERRADIRVVFTDINMPGSMDGLKLAAAVRGRWPPVELILTSGRGLFPGADLPVRAVFIPKPYKSEVVLAAVRRMAA